MILKHRDTEVLRFEWLGPQQVRIVSVNDAARRFLPLDFAGEVNDEKLLKWLTGRVVPKHRRHIQFMLTSLGLNDHDLRGIVDIGKGLSLNDVYWVVKDDFNGRWSRFNLYENRFNKTIQFMTLAGEGPLMSTPEWTSSPEFTTNGMLAKCWRRVDGVPVLYKGGTTGFANAGFEPYSEYYAAQIAEAMGLKHVEYGLAKFKGVLCSTCPIFTSDKTGFLPAARVYPHEQAISDPAFADLFFFDAIIHNTDRHLGNFGYLVDNDTNEIMGPAPIFDNGYGLFSLALFKNKYANEFADLRTFTDKQGPALFSDGWLKFPGGITPAMLKRLEGLHGFRFKHHPYYNLPTERLRIIEDFLQKRIREIEEYGEKADEFLKIPHANDTINNVDGIAAEGNLEEALKANINADPFISQEELAEILGVSRPTVARLIKKLQDSGVLVRTGSRKTGAWRVV